MSDIDNTSEETTSKIVIPSNPNTLILIKQKMQEITNAKARISGEKNLIKTIIKDLSDETEISKSDLRALAGVMEDGSADALVQKASDMESLFFAVNKSIAEIYADAKERGNEVPEDQQIKEVKTIG